MYAGLSQNLSFEKAQPQVVQLKGFAAARDGLVAFCRFKEALHALKQILAAAALEQLEHQVAACGEGAFGVGEDRLGKLQRAA